MPRNNKILPLILLLIVLAGGGWYFWRKNSDKNSAEQIAFNTGFVLLDDEKSLVQSKAVQLSPEARAVYENKVKEIRAALAKEKVKDNVLADYNNLAVYEKYLGNLRAAYEAYLESLKLESQARVAWQNFADVLVEMKAYKSAEMAYKKAIELNKYIPESYNKLADFYKLKGLDAQVEATYKLAIETIKQSTESDELVLNDYANWLIDKKRFADAIKILEELEKKQPENKDVFDLRIEELRSK